MINYLIHYLASLFELFQKSFFPLIDDKSFGEISDLKPFKHALRTLCGFADPNDLATTSRIPKTSHTDLIAPPAIIPVPEGAVSSKLSLNHFFL